MCRKKNQLIQKNLKGVISDATLKEQLDLVEKKELENQATLVMLGNTTGSPEEAVEFAEEYLRKPSSIWKNADISTQTKLQWFQFPSGVTFNGNIFGTKQIANVFKAKEVILSPLSATVDPTGLEPATPSLQMRCSTR